MEYANLAVQEFEKITNRQLDILASNLKIAEQEVLLHQDAVERTRQEIESKKKQLEALKGLLSKSNQ